MNKFIDIHEIGDTMAESIYNFFQDEDNKKIVQSCLDAGIRFAEVEKIIRTKFTGKTFVLTGSLEKFSRKDAQSMLEKQGARVSSTVSSKTDFLVAGPGAGSKLDKAKELDIPIFSEAEFLGMLDGNE